MFDLDASLIELYLIRFCVVRSSTSYSVHRRHLPLVEAIGLPWDPGPPIRVMLDSGTIESIGSEHFNLIQANARGMEILFGWFPPTHHPTADEGRLLVRAGVQIKFAS